MKYALGLFLFVVSIAPLPARAQATFNGCGMAGTATSVCGKALNRLKNRDTAPSPSDINSAITLNSILAPGDDLNRWDTSQAAEITGYVADVTPGGKETCNCGQANLEDIHIDVVLDPADAGDASKYFIVEITPRWKAKNHWTPTSVRKALKNHWVKFHGWMTLDTMHVRSATNTRARTKQSCGTLPPGNIWRATAWEMHPVTDVEVLTGPPH